MQDRNWTVDKRLNIGHLISTIVLAGAVFAWAQSMEHRVTSLEAAAVQQIAVDRRQDQQLTGALALLSTQLGDLKVDIRMIRQSIEQLNRDHGSGD